MKKVLSIILLTISSFLFVYTFSLSPSNLETKEDIGIKEVISTKSSNINYNDFILIDQINTLYELKSYGYINYILTISKNRVSEEKSLYMLDMREEVTPGICASNNGNDLYKNYLLDSGYMHIKVLQAVEEIDQATIRYGAIPKVIYSWPYNIDDYNNSQINRDNASISHSKSSIEKDEFQWLFSIKNNNRRQMTFPLNSIIIFEMNNDSELMDEDNFSLKIDFGINFNKKINIKNGKEIFAKKIEKTIYFNYF